MRQAAEQHGVAATAPLTLADGRPGTLMYVPIMDGARLTGYVAGAFAYERVAIAPDARLSIDASS